MNETSGTETLSSDVPKEQAPYFFTASTAKFVLMSICTSGLYELYWYYKNWVLIKNRSNSNIMPFWRAFFAPIWAYSCFKEIQNSAIEQGAPQLSSIGWIAVRYFILQTLWRFPDPYWLISILSFLPMIPANSVAIAVNNKIAPNVGDNSNYSGWNWVGLILGGLLLIAAVIGAFMPNS